LRREEARRGDKGEKSLEELRRVVKRVGKS
jgi:hypothetical protein